MQTIDRWYEDYEVGETRHFTGRTITEADIVLHAGQTGDFFPHHMDAEWAATQPIGQRIAHGTLILSIAVGMTAADINPQSMSYGYDRLGYVHELVSVTNQRGETPLVLTHLYLVNKRIA
jgi:acyl dehydratase